MVLQLFVLKPGTWFCAEFQVQDEGIKVSLIGHKHWTILLIFTIPCQKFRSNSFKFHKLAKYS